jgi:hypothetical protein
MQVQMGEPPGLPVLAHLPALPWTVQAEPALQREPPGRLAQLPDWKKPARCRRPGTPSSWEQTP